MNKEAIDDPDFKKISSTDNKGLALSFVNGPPKIALMGAEFELFTIVLMVGFKIIRIETDDDMARLYIINAEENQWMLYKTCAFTRKQAAEEQKRMQKTYLNALN